MAIFAVCTSLAGCGVLQPAKAPPAADSALSEGQTRPAARPDILETAQRTPPPTARTVEDFDTTTAEERNAASRVDTASEQALGSTVVSLGDPTQPGFWIETPLVTTAGQGRVRYPGTGQTAQVQLIPIDGPATAGSRLSLAAMRLIGAPLTGLVEVQVFSGG